jgi:dihydroorotase
MGMPLHEVIFRSTVTPAREVGHPELGTLSVGAEADVAVLNVREGPFALTDCGRATVTASRRLECRLTVRAGKIVYNPEGLGLSAWPDAPPEYWGIRQAAGTP